MNCYHCNAPISQQHAIGFNEYCHSCNFDLHVCLQCGFHDKSYNNECRESQSDRVVDKQKRNYCEFFQAASKETGALKKNDLLSAAEALFKKNN